MQATARSSIQLPKICRGYSPGPPAKSSSKQLPKSQRIRSHPASFRPLPQMGSQREVVLAMYRALYRQAKFLDSRRVYKALLPQQLPLPVMAILGRNRDFYGSNQSCVDAIKQTAKKNRQMREKDVKTILDICFRMLRTTSRIESIVKRNSEELNYHKDERMAAITFEDKYDSARRKDPALDKALSLIEDAKSILEDSSVDQEEKITTCIAKYEESIQACPTADGHTYLGHLKSYSGDLDAAIDECKRAIEIDEDFGNPYNDMGLYYIHQSREEEAVHSFKLAARARRYDCRHYPHLNLAAYYLEVHEPEHALIEYLQALEILGPEKGAMYRETVSDMAGHLASLGPG